MDEIESIKAEMEKVKAELEQAKAAIAPVESEYSEFQNAEKEAYAAYQLQIAAIREKKAVIDQSRFEFQSKINQAQATAAQLQRTLQRAEDEKKLKEARAEREAELLLLNERWDKLTLSARWREWAKDHQIEAGHFLTENRCVILADPMGLGKTLSAIITTDMVEAATRQTSEEFPFLGEEKQVYSYENKGYITQIVNQVKRPVGKRILYFCPASLIRNVEKEYRMWAGHRNVTYVGGMTKAERTFVFENVLDVTADYVLICNYEAWRKDLNLINQMVDLDPDTVILDEAHNLKNMKTSAYKGIRKLLDEAKPEYIIPMTGTPILNRPQELFTLLNLVNQEEFYRENDFLLTYCEQNDAGFWKFQEGGIDRIAKRIRKNFIRRTKDQAGIDLPPQTVINHDLVLDTEAYPEQAKVRKQMKEYATIMIDEAEGKAIAAAAMIAVFTRLRQIETWPAGICIKDKFGNIKMQVDVEESQKVDYVISKEPDENGNYQGLIPEAIDDERIVLFSQFKAPLQEIKKRVELAGYRAVVLDGSVDATERELISNDFDARYTSNRKDSKYDVVLCNYRVGGVGLNFTAATQLIVLDEEWNPGKRDQAYGRIDRIGQENPTTVHVIRNQKTIDDWLASIMANKESLVDGFDQGMVSMQEFKDFLDGDTGGLL